MGARAPGESRPAYDYIIIGAGASGCVLANRLSADPDVTVLLVESGPRDDSPLIPIPRAIGRLLKPGNPYVSTYQVSPAGNAAPETWLKGRTLGGSTSINGMGYARGAPADYDGWEALGCTGWGWDEMRRRFVELEDHALGGADGRGAGGPLRVSVQKPVNRLCEAILSAAESLGTVRVADINGAEAVRAGGMGYQPSTTSRGRRVSAADAFLHPVAKRPNLDVLTETDALRVLFDARRAAGVELRDARGTTTVAARREVILAAGAIMTPKLLQLSGVGPGALLRPLGIDIVSDLPAVGRNLREHRYISMLYRVTGGSLNRRFTGAGLAGSALRYLLGRRGPLGHAAQELGGFVKTRPELDHADAQIAIGLYSMHLGEKGVTVDAGQGITIVTYFTRPESTGEIAIVSPDFDAPPRIDANQLSAEIDRASSLAAVRWVRALVRQPALAPWIVGETAPGAALEGDDELLSAMLASGGPGYHICGTARMGGDVESVVDPALRVRGVTGLRVVDTSIMPTIPSGNTAGPAMAVALRAADLIRQAA